MRSVWCAFVFRCSACGLENLLVLELLLCRVGCVRVMATQVCIHARVLYEAPAETRARFAQKEIIAIRIRVQ